jgi:two-component system NarL family response regulator
VKVLALSTHLERQLVAQMLEAGASGYVAKSTHGDELLRAIRAVSRNSTYLCPEVAAVMIDTMRGKTLSEVPRGEPLGRREREVLALLAEGKTSQEIASQLFISTSTVIAHRRNISRKLGLHSVAELTRFAIREGLIAS